MLTIKSRDTASIRATNYSLILGSIFIIASALFFQAYNALALAAFLVSEAAMLIWIFSERRTQMLKIQGKRLDIVYGSTHTNNWTSYSLTELNGELLKFNPIVGAPCCVLKIFRENKLIGVADSRKGFDKSRLKILLSLIKLRAY